jgi:RNA polymerase sigma-70 factor (ECF subfamily)
MGHVPPDDDHERRRLRAGDPDAFAAFYRRHQPGVYAYIHRLSGGRAVLAEDVCQQVFLNFWTHRESYDLDKPLVPLLLTMARNSWINAAKKEEYRKTSELKEDGASAPDRGNELRELEHVVDRALKALDPDLREVFVLSRYHELKYAQIAEILGLSIKTIEARLSRALQELQKRLKDFL